MATRPPIILQSEPSLVSQNLIIIINDYNFRIAVIEKPIQFCIHANGSIFKKKILLQLLAFEDLSI